MEFGVVLGFTGPQGQERSEKKSLFERVLELATEADRYGIDYLWAQEHHLIEVIQSPSALLTCVWVAQHVKAKVGTAVVVLPYHDPIQVAGEVAQADNMTGGRLQFGVARGAYKYEFEKFGISFESSRANFIEKLDAIRALLNNEDTETDFHGDFVNFDGAYIWPRPQQRPSPPIWLGAQAPAAIGDAASRGYNVLTSLFLWTDEHVANLTAAFKEGQAASGKTDTKFGITRFAYFAENEADAENAVTQLIDKWRVMQQLHDFSHTANPRGIIEPLPQPNEPTREDVRANVLIGTRKQILNKLDFYRDLGIDIVNLAVNFGCSHDEVLGSMARFGEVFGSYSLEGARL
jgi:alkanesulfonate monooxygenase SsuD/methylene tetrahydromethanopterin reductase-like flavin-dependent oxidoreductase (luciferase family)